MHYDLYVTVKLRPLNWLTVLNCVVLYELVDSLKLLNLVGPVALTNGYISLQQTEYFACLVHLLLLFVNSHQRFESVGRPEDNLLG